MAMGVERATSPSKPECAKCAIGAASGEGAGGRCIMVDRNHRAGATLYLEGERTEKVWFVKRGRIALSRTVDAHRGTDALWAVRRPGSVLGIEALARDTYLDTARAVTDVTMCAASIDTVRQWLATRAEAAMAVLGCMVAAQCGDGPRGASADGSAMMRVSTWLLNGDAQQRAQGLPRTVVAEMLGIEPETLSRTLGALASGGLIRVTRRSVAVVDAVGLARVAEGGRRAPAR
jgi:CRP-like cAMP-binding protein